jgi:hypothetical protein
MDLSCDEVDNVSRMKNLSSGSIATVHSNDIENKINLLTSSSEAKTMLLRSEQEPRIHANRKRKADNDTKPNEKETSHDDASLNVSPRKKIKTQHVVGSSPTDSLGVSTSSTVKESPTTIANNTAAPSVPPPHDLKMIKNQKPQKKRVMKGHNNDMKNKKKKKKKKAESDDEDENDDDHNQTGIEHQILGSSSWKKNLSNDQKQDLQPLLSDMTAYDTYFNRCMMAQYMELKRQKQLNHLSSSSVEDIMSMRSAQETKMNLLTTSADIKMNPTCPPPATSAPPPHDQSKKVTVKKKNIDPDMDMILSKYYQKQGGAKKSNSATSSDNDFNRRCPDPQCKSNNVLVDVIFTRGLDEPATEIFTCTDCGKTWR